MVRLVLTETRAQGGDIGGSLMPPWAWTGRFICCSNGECQSFLGSQAPAPTYSFLLPKIEVRVQP